MKLKTECDPNLIEDEIVIRYSKRTEGISRIEELIQTIVYPKDTLALHIRDAEYYIPVADILYFETDGGEVKAHTDKRIFTSDKKLFELCEMLGDAFIRVSKCCVVNVNAIEALKRNITGSGDILFKGCDKIAYVSRIYYPILKERLVKLRSL